MKLIFCRFISHLPSIECNTRVTIGVDDLPLVRITSSACEMSVDVILDITVGVSTTGQPSNLVSSKPCRPYIIAKVIFRPVGLKILKEIIYNCLICN